MGEFFHNVVILSLSHNSISYVALLSLIKHINNYMYILYKLQLLFFMLITGNINSLIIDWVRFVTAFTYSNILLTVKENPCISNEINIKLILMNFLFYFILDMKAFMK